MKKSVFLQVFLPAFVFCLISTTIQPACAEEPSAYLDDIVVTATKIEEPKKDVSASLQVITQEDIKDSTAKDAGDLVTEASVGHVTKYLGALTGLIELRGLSTDLYSALSSRVLVLVNGSRAGTVNLAELPADDIERIEIVKGPASVLYGSSAMGGVINIITKKGREGFHGFAGGELGSWNYWKTEAGLEGRTGKFDYFLTAALSSQDDFKAAGFGRRENSGFKDETISGRAGYTLFDDHRISLGFQYWRGWDMGVTGASYDPDPDNYADKLRSSVDLGYETKSFNAKYYFTKVTEKSYGGMVSGPGNSDLFASDADTQGASLQKTFSLGEHRVIIGGQWDRVTTTTWRNSGAPYYPDSQYDNYGLFGEGRLSLFNKKLLVSAGLRYDYFENEILATPGITALIPKTEELDHLTARGGIVYKLTDALSLKGNVGTAFRAPAPLELAADYVSWGTHTVGNPDLKPEQSTTYDLGIDYSHAAFKSDLTFFHTDFRDKISSYYDTSMMVSTYRNIEGATIQGIEFNAAYDLGPVLGIDISVAPFTNITYKTEFEDESGEKLFYVPRWTGAFGIKAGAEKWDARLIANYTAGERVTDWNYSSPTYGQGIDKGGFTVVHLKGSYRPVRHLEITASLENLLDRAYEYTLGYPMPGRTVTAGLKWFF